jgi:hypothetical protein
MKKFKLILPLMAFIFAMVTAFAFKPGTEDFDLWYKVDPDSPTDCIQQTECTLPSGTTCGFTVKDASCQTSPRFKP